MALQIAGGTRIDEVADGIFRISTPVDSIAGGGITYNQYLIVDDEPLLFHTGKRRMFPQVQAAVARVMPLERLRWISFSHFEADECGALNEFLNLAPNAEPLCRRRDGECERFHWPAGTRIGRRGLFFHRQVPVSLLPHPAPAARLGRWRAVRGKSQDLAVLGLIPSVG